MQPLTPEKLEHVQRSNPEWKLHDGKLISERTFPDFVTAMAFVNRVAEIAEAAGHHPDIDIRYNRVTLGLVTHDANGITQRDADMARKLTLELTK